MVEVKPTVETTSHGPGQGNRGNCVAILRWLPVRRAGREDEDFCLGSTKR